MTERDLIAEYRIYLQVEKGLSANSLASYGHDLARLREWATGCGVAPQDLRREHLRTWVIALGKKDLKPKSVARMISAVRGFFKWLQIDGHRRDNPAEDLDAPPPAQYVPRFLTPREVNMLFAAPDTSTHEGLRDRAILELFYATGLRVSELTALRLAAFDWDTGILICEGKGSKQRRLPIGRSALQWLNYYRVKRAAIEGDKGPQFFLHSRGGPLSRQQIYEMVGRYAQQAGLREVTPHTLRHTYATHLMQGGADVRSVQTLLGHSDIGTTQIYTHLTTQQVRRTYDSHHPRARATLSATVSTDSDEET